MLPTKATTPGHQRQLGFLPEKLNNLQPETAAHEPPPCAPKPAKHHPRRSQLRTSGLSTPTPNRAAARTSRAAERSADTRILAAAHLPRCQPKPTPRPPTHSSTRSSRPNPATANDHAATAGARHSGRCRRAPPLEPGGRAATPPVTSHFFKFQNHHAFMSIFAF
jgi:hypothetical protein